MHGSVPGGRLAILATLGTTPGRTDAIPIAANAMKLAQIMGAFHRAFADESVIVAGGFDEPFYRAPRDGAPAEIRFNRDYLNSCLHEIAHWCIAGRERRARDDY